MNLVALIALGFFALGLVGAAEPASASGVHTAGHSATHMEIKNHRGLVVCAIYDTHELSRPTAWNCPAGTYIEQLFDQRWRQIGQRTVTISRSTEGLDDHLSPFPSR